MYFLKKHFRSEQYLRPEYSVRQNSFHKYLLLCPYNKVCMLVTQNMNFCPYLVTVAMISLKRDDTINGFQHTVFKFQVLLNCIILCTVGTLYFNKQKTAPVIKCNTIRGSSNVLIILVNNKARTLNLESTYIFPARFCGHQLLSSHAYNLRMWPLGKCGRSSIADSEKGIRDCMATCPPF